MIEFIKWVYADAGGCILAIIGLLILQSVLSVLFGWKGSDDGNWIDDITHNTSLALSGKVNPNIKQNTTIGWRPDPHGNDGYTKAKGQTPSGNDEYSRVIRKVKP